MNEPIRTFDILVAGGGLVGAVFAARLAACPEAAGLRIAIIEREPLRPEAHSERFDPRVVALTEASRQLLAEAGVWTEAVAARACPYRHMAVRDSEGTGLIEFDCTEVHQANLGHIVENSVVVEAAHARIATLANICFLYDSIARVNRSEDGERLILTLAGGGRVSAPLLVAADGANSLVRDHCGFRLRTWDYGHSAIVTTIRTEKPHGAAARQWFTAHGPLAFLPLQSPDGDCHYSSIVWSQDHQVARELMALDDQQFVARLSRASEFCLGAVTATAKRYSFPLIQRHAVDYVKPGVALVGDAAHTIHPLAGQGVNLGFGDVRALVDEISRGLARNLPVGEASTLARFQRRRKPDNLAMMAAMEGFKRLFADDNPVLRVLRNRGMSGINGLGPVKTQLIRRAMGF